ncbi:MAG TPA: glycerate-2-kinase family protein, partial [Steroidobacteraceae bacterium]|nr:glycerate-2-kinase family protein [Steroidobacteraceae bacterium]
MHDRAAVSADSRRDVLLELYASACRAVDGRRAVRAALAGRPAPAELALIAVGKAAGAMTLGALDVLGARVTRGLVISRAGHLDPELGAWAQLELLEGDHPVPGAASLAAGARLLEFAAATPAGARVLVLVSGGASSLVEALPPSVSAADLKRVNEWGLGAGLGIGDLNAIRRRLSRLKDGRLARALEHASAEALLISDVPGDDPAVIGSGLVMAQAAQPAPAVPDWLAALLGRAAGLPPGGALPSRVVATLGDALAAAERAADQQGLATRRLAPPAAGDALAA